MKYLLLLAVLIQTLAIQAESSGVAGPRAVVIRSGAVQLRGLFWLPRGRGRFPAILFNHGSGRSREELERLGPYEWRAETLGPVFARHGYAFLYLFRRGVGLSADQGASSVDLMNAEFAAHGQDARNAIQLQLLENREISDSLAQLGGFAGPYMVGFLDDRTHSLTSSFLFVALVYLAAGILILSLGIQNPINKGVELSVVSRLALLLGQHLARKEEPWL
jgi:hypothetical protein